jgi:hypothetical protein
MLSYDQIWTIVNSWGIQLRVTRLRNLTLLVLGLIHGESGCLSAIVRAWPSGPVRHTHRLKRLHRFLNNRGLDVAAVSAQVAQVAWSHRPGGQRTTLLPIAIDWTKVRQFPVLWAAMPRRRRAVPLAHGVYHPDRLRHSQNKLERGLCALVASWVPAELTPLFLADRGFGRTEFVRWLQRHGFAFVVRLRADTHVQHRGQRGQLGQFDTIEGAPILLKNVRYRVKERPVTVHIVVSRLGDSVWYLGTTFTDPRQAVSWYKKRFWIEEMFRDMKSRLGLRQAAVTHEQRLYRLLLGYQLAHFILWLVGLRVPKRWQRHFSSRDRLCQVWLALKALPRFRKRRHRKVWDRHVWPTLLAQSG